MRLKIPSRRTTVSVLEQGVCVRDGALYSCLHRWTELETKLMFPVPEMDPDLVFFFVIRENTALIMMKADYSSLHE